MRDNKGLNLCSVNKNAEKILNMREVVKVKYKEIAMIPKFPIMVTRMSTIQY